MQQQYNQIVDYVPIKHNKYNQKMHHYMEASVFITRNAKCLALEYIESGSGRGFYSCAFGISRGRKASSKAWNTCKRTSNGSLSL